MLKTIAFDFDGTLADSLELCIVSFERVFADRLAENAPSRAGLTKFFGMNEEGILHHFLPDCTADALRDYYRYYEALHGQFCPAPFPGIAGFLNDVKNSGIQVTLLTGKSETSAQISLHKLGLDGIFADCRYGSPHSSSKAPQLKSLMRDYGLAPEELCYAGDAVSDVQSAHAAGLCCLSAAWAGTADVAGLEAVNPGLVFRRMPDMLAWLRQNMAPQS